MPTSVKNLILIALLGSAWSIPAAAGNVLLPPDTSATPNLGFMPPPEPALVEKPPEQIEKKEPVEKPLPLAPPPAPAPAPAPVPPPPPTGTSTMLDVRLDARSMWSEQDIRTVSSQLGLAPQQVGTACRVGLAGTLITDLGVYNVDTGLAPYASAVYEGAVSQIMLGARALCDAAPRPASPLIQPTNGRWVVPLSSAFCPVKARENTHPRSVVITRRPDGNDTCLFDRR